MNTAMELTMDELETVNGGKLEHLPNDYILEQCGVSDIVKYTGGWSDGYYDTKRGNSWKNVGSEDMLKYVARTIGENDPRYIALEKYCCTKTPHMFSN